jgi:hypothetical protein
LMQAGCRRSSLAPDASGQRRAATAKRELPASGAADGPVNRYRSLSDRAGRRSTFGARRRGGGHCFGGRRDVRRGDGALKVRR